MAAVNIRCLEGIDLAAIPVTDFDGRSLLVVELEGSCRSTIDVDA